MNSTKEIQSNELNEVLKIIGEKISKVRKTSKKKIDTVSKSLKIRAEYLIAIEEGDIEKLPEEVYMKGFVKSYADFFDLDISREMNLITNNSYKSSLISNQQIDKSVNSLPSSKIFITVFIVFVLIFFSINEYKKTSYKFENLIKTEKDDNLGLSYDVSKKKIQDTKKILLNENDKSITREIKTQEILIEKQFESNAIQKGTDQVIDSFSSENIKKNIFEKKNIQEFKVNFLETTWIQVKNIDGSIYKSGIYNNGESILLIIDKENKNYFIDTGNAGGFKIQFENTDLPLLGNLGTVKKNISLLGYYEKFNKFE